MSAFVVNEETINKAVTLISRDSTTMSQRQKSDLGDRIWQMNTAAVAQRYNDKPEEVAMFVFHPANYSVAECLKAMHCVIYQCSEGDVLEWSLYKLLDGVADNVSETISRDSADYENADWG